MIVGSRISIETEIKIYEGRSRVAPRIDVDDEHSVCGRDILEVDGRPRYREDDFLDQRESAAGGRNLGVRNPRHL